MLLQAKYKMKPPMSAKLMPGHPLAIGLVGLWLFNEGSGGQVFDLSGNGYVGILTGNPIWLPGKHGHALSFDSSNYVDVGGGSVIPLVAPYSISTWVRKTSGDVDKGIYWGDRDTTDNYIWLNEGVKLRFTTSSGRSEWTTDVNFDNRWRHYVVIAYDSTTTGLYIDAVFQGTDTVVTTNTQFNSLGHGFSNEAFTFIGSVCNECVYKRALSASEIALLYREPFCMFNWEWLPGWVATAGDIKEVSGVITGTSSLSAVAQRTREVSGVIAATSQVTALAERDREVSGVIAAQSNLYGRVEGVGNAIFFGSNF